MRYLTILLAALAAACVSTSAPAGDKAALARRIAELERAPNVLAAQALSYIEEYLREIPDYAAFCEDARERNACEEMGREINAEIRTTLQQTANWLEPLRESMIADSADVMVDLYTEAELRTYLVYLESPDGRSMNAKRADVFIAHARNEYAYYRPWADMLTSMVNLVYEKHRATYEASIADR